MRGTHFNLKAITIPAKGQTGTELPAPATTADSAGSTISNVLNLFTNFRFRDGNYLVHFKNGMAGLTPFVVRRLNLPTEGEECLICYHQKVLHKMNCCGKKRRLVFACGKF